MSDWTTVGASMIAAGDCREVLATMPDDSVAAVVTDPPYGLSRAPDMLEVLRHWLDGDDYQHDGKGFMGKSWDSFVPGHSIWKEVLRVLKPGGHAVVFAGSRTADLMTVALRIAGFEIRDTLMWIYGSGFPKSLNVSKAIDKAAGAEREVVGYRVKRDSFGDASVNRVYGTGPDHGGKQAITAPATPDSQQWDGWGSALKPAYEPIILARKPFKGTVANNVLSNGTGAINIDATRIATTENLNGGAYAKNGSDRKELWGGAAGNSWKRDGSAGEFEQPSGRWPANVLLTHHEDCVEIGVKRVKATSIHGTAEATRRSGAHSAAGGHQRVGRVQPVTGHADADGMETLPAFECHPDCPVRLLDEQTGTLTSGKGAVRRRSGADRDGNTGAALGAESRPAGSPMISHGDSGGASRFFYNAKAARSERNLGLPADLFPKGNDHPTVKPVDVMRWLVRLVAPPDGMVLDPFCGSGSTLVACEHERRASIGIDLDPAHVELSVHRVRWAADNRKAEK